MVEGHASLKVLARRRPRQLLKLVAGLHQLRIPPLHLNVTTVDAMVLYTFSLKVITINIIFLKQIRRTADYILIKKIHILGKYNNASKTPKGEGASINKHKLNLALRPVLLQDSLSR